MPSTINALSTGSGGLVQTADASGVLQLQTNNTTALTVDTTQKTTISNLSASAYSPVTSLLTSGTAQNTTSGTAIDFTGIPSWVKRITVMFNGVSTSGTSGLLLQIGSGSITSTGYASGAWSSNTGNAGSTSGFLLTGDFASAEVHSGHLIITSVFGFLYVQSGVLGQSVSPAANGAGSISGGNITLSGTLDRVRITTVNGTDTFDAGSINILYE